MNCKKKIYKLERKLYHAVQEEVRADNQSSTKCPKSEEEMLLWLGQLKTCMQQRLQVESTRSLPHVLKKVWGSEFKKITKILKTHFKLVMHKSINWSMKISSNPIELHS